MLKKLFPFRFTHDGIVYFAGGIPFALIFARAGADIILTLTVLIFLIRCLHVRDASWMRRPLFAVLLLLWAYTCLVSGLFADDPPHALALGFTSLRFFLFFIAMGHWILRDAKDVRYIAWFIGLTLLFMGVDVATQWTTGRSLFGVPRFDTYRLTGSMHLPDAGTYIAKLWFPALGMFLWMVRRKYLPAVIAAAIFLVPWILLSGERSGTLMFILSLCASGGYAALLWPKGRPVLLGLAGGFALALALVVTCNPFIHARMLMLIDQVPSFGQTVYGQMWKGAFLLWESHPIIGVGIGGFRDLCPSLRYAGRVTYCDIHPHNTYLEWLSSGGIVALALYVTFVVLLVKSVIPKPSPLGRGKGDGVILAACMLGTYVMNLFPVAVTQGAFSNWAATLEWFSLAAAMSLLRLHPDSSSSGDP